MEGDAFVDAFGNRLPLDRLKACAGQPLARCKAAWKDQIVTWRRHPIDVLEHLVDADPGAVLRIFQACCNYVAAPQLREWGIFVFAGALDIQDRMAGGTTPFASQFGAELARSAELNVIGKQLLIFGVRALLDDELLRLQLKSGDEGVL